MLIFIYVLVAIALAGGSWALYFKNKYMPAPPESDTTNKTQSTNTNQAKKGDLD
jgi:hypothetical protein